MDDSLKSLHGLLPNNSRILPTQLQSLALGLHSSMQRGLDGLPGLAASMELDYAAALQRRVQLEEHARFELIARAAGLHRSLPRPLPNPPSAWINGNIYFEQEKVNVSSAGPLRKRRKLMDSANSIKGDGIAVMPLRKAERKATWPLPAEKGDGYKPTTGPMVAFQKTWKCLEDKVTNSEKLDKKAKEDFLAELFCRSLHKRSAGMDHLFRKVHGLTSKEASSAPPKKRRILEVAVVPTIVNTE
jgi:hypothetical protein